MIIVVRELLLSALEVVLACATLFESPKCEIPRAQPFLLSFLSLPAHVTPASDSLR